MFQAAPCNWPIAYPELAEGADCEPCAALDELSESVRASVEDMAIGLLWAWSGRRYGTCPVSVRPCRERCPDRPATFWGSAGFPAGSIPQTGGWTPALVAGQWYNMRCGVCPSSRCSCAADNSRTIELPGNVASITSIWVDGAELAPEAYALRDGVLYRLDGGVWPQCNDQFADPQAPDSAAWEITYERGYLVPAGGQYAAYRLACELAKARCGDNTCELPARLQTVTRQGVTVATLDGFENLAEGMTGIWEIDAWLKSVEYRPASPPQVFSPDLQPGFGRGTFGSLGIGGRR